MKKRRQPWGWILASILAWGATLELTRSATPPPDVDTTGDETTETAFSEEDPLGTAFENAIRAANLAQSAETPEDWSAVAIAWSAAIQALQAVPPDSPEWLFAQRKTREYLTNQEIALQRAEAAGTSAVFPTLGNPVLDEQLAVYLSYVATFGPPDVLVIGSSRALQGLNPQILQQRLSQQGIESPRAYTFAVNGATAQVVSFILRQLLTQEQMPEMIVWAGGSRSFNSGRVDRTFARILESPGYAALQAGDRPKIDDPEETTDSEDSEDDKNSLLPVTTINSYGFLRVSDVFEPSVYYQNFPRVAGLYDSSYQAFNLDGVQTMSFRAIANFAQANDIPLIFVNLPLSADYLDETRLFYEQQFQQYLETESRSGGFTVVDLLQEWPDRNNIFADPSHLNQVGAAQVAMKIAADPSIPWDRLNESEALSEADEEEAAE
ncbi:hypothetical protein PN498_12855 [Oscillatoria sp. CS-180]|uniref:hypothetical protein n=1 Tax=Oscillatoria sp. CS-180 TaxID=3021720 RepID=UPI0023313380|nr:hypothetical protein [Oscillatoria sp. CS-180]MDB9526881.1 hypothetical protein [Oscillatoria sp. CS-180]